MVPFQLHGYGTDICVSNGPCFRRSSEIELHPYSVDGGMIFPVVCERLSRVLKSKLKCLSNVFWVLICLFIFIMRVVISTEG